MRTKIMNRYKWKFWTWNQRIYLRDGSLYLTRYRFDFYLFSIRIHRFTQSDDDRAFHDHPWGFVTLVLSGGYWDVTKDGREWVGPGRFRFRPLGHTHTVELKDGKPCWSIVLAGRYQHRWGFYVKNSLGEDRFVNSKRYFLEFGHH